MTTTTTMIITIKTSRVASQEKFARHTLIRETFTRETLTNFVIFPFFAKLCLVELLKKQFPKVYLV